MIAGGAWELVVSGSRLPGPPMAAAVRSHFNNCPDAHSTFCFHGTCRFLVQEEEPTCVCHSGYMGARCELADLLAVVADTQKKQTITALVVVSIVASIVVTMVCVLIHCCRIRKRCEWCRTVVCRQEKPTGLLKGATSCCHSETGKATVSGPIWHLSFQTIKSWFCHLARAEEEGWHSSRRRPAGKGEPWGSGPGEGARWGEGALWGGGPWRPHESGPRGTEWRRRLKPGL
uniref:Transforming growth factor alpha n=1 Tax=Pseudonaja textilis TaxID=8673 RepID=A0A670ZLZ7_PSETE